MIGKDIISIDQFNKSDLKKIISTAKIMENNFRQKQQTELLRGNIMASLFFEPSTRTRFSFEAAMERLGGSVISTTGFAYSSIAKGETLADTIKTVDRYCDVIVIRHPEIGSAEIAAKSAQIPVINAGDGPGEHPTQALLDLYTIEKAKNSTHNLCVAMVGDLKNGRTVHSLVKLLIKYDKVEFYLVSPNELKIPEKYIKFMNDNNIKFHEIESLDDAIKQCDVLYMTRVQRERFETEDEYNKLKGCFILDAKILKKAKKDMIILHPLPRVDEIATEVDNDPRAKYFDQVENGLYIRMALLALVLNKSDALI
jgi:aspartate carbamoyltransferase